MDLCFIVDSSGSIRDNNPPDGRFDNWQLQREFLASIAQAFSIGPDATQIGAVIFSENAELVFPLNGFDQREDIIEALLNMAYIGGQTNTPDALSITRTQCFSTSNGDRRDVDNLAIIVTDGVPYPDSRQQPAIEEAKRLQNSGALMVAIGITTVIDEAFLKEMSSPPQTLNRNYFTATNFEALSEIRKVVVEGTCETIQGKHEIFYCYDFAMPP